MFLSIASRAQCTVQSHRNHTDYMFSFYAPAKDKKAQLKVIDTAGKIVYASRVKVLKGFNASTFHSARFAPGTYKVTISNVFTTNINNDVRD